MKILCISGKARHGKDLSGEIFKALLEKKDYKVLIAHQADLVKYICTRFFNWNGIKDYEGRTLLQHVGTDVVRAQHPDYWVEFLCGIFEMFPDVWDYVIIPDTRFPNEIDLFKERGFDVKHIRIVRPDFDNGLTEEQKNHASETALDNVVPDETILNDGTLSDLHDKIDAFINKYIGD